MGGQGVVPVEIEQTFKVNEIRVAFRGYMTYKRFKGQPRVGL